jgi:uncharacterized membrane protein YjgN (DUF898 family)
LIVVSILALFYFLDTKLSLQINASTIVIVIFLPFIIQKAIKFDMLNSSYRNIRFGFNAKLKESYIVFLVFGFIGVVLSMGLLYPYFSYKRQQYLVQNRNYGENKFQIQLVPKEFYKIYIKFFLILSLLLGAIGYAGTYAFENFSSSFDMKKIIKTEKFTTKKEIVNGKQKMVFYDKNNRKIPYPKTSMTTFGMILTTTVWMIFYMLIYIVSYSYLNAHVVNYTFNNISINGVRFKSELKFTKLMKIYFTNIILIIFTFGLMIPYAKIQLIKYRISTLTILISDDTSNFSTKEISDESAFGEEYGEYLNIDLGL